MSNTNEPPEMPPHVVGEILTKQAWLLGYNIRDLNLVYYVGMDEVVTTIKQSDLLWEHEVKDTKDNGTTDT